MEEQKHKRRLHFLIYKPGKKWLGINDYWGVSNSNYNKNAN